MIRQNQRSRERLRLGRYTREDYRLDHPHEPAAEADRHYDEEARAEEPGPLPMLRDRLKRPSPRERNPNP